MANAPTDYVNLPSCSKRKVIEIEDFASANAANRALANQLVKEQLNSLDLIECVVKLADTAVSDDIKVFLEMIVNKSPELVFMGLLQIDVSIKCDTEQ
jgi:CCR4-NOT transcription complex subunit 1